MNIKTYFTELFPYDLKAGFITAVVALPLAIAFAIASGVPPIMGMYTAIIAGILASLFGGSIYSITGPTGAMTVIILSTLNKLGLEGLMLAGFMAGVFQLFFSLVRLGRFVKFIPLPIVSGFTAGIGAIIFIGQIGNSLGLVIPSEEHVWSTFIDLFKALSSVNIIAVAITLLTVLSLVFLPKYLGRVKFLKNVPASLIPLLLSTLAVFLFDLTIPQVGVIPRGLPEFHLININFDLLQRVLPAAFTIALLGSIEALLCAVVCDGMTNTRHKSDKELRGQGISNMVLPFFGGIACTAAIARSAVNIREGARTKYAAIIHSLFLLLILLFLAPLAQYIPKAFLAGILMVVSFRMINIHEFKTIMKISHSETIVLFVTFGLTIFTDLVFAVQMGMVFAIFLLFIKLTRIIDITNMADYQRHEGLNAFVYRNEKLKDIVSIYSINGPFFFGAMNVFDKKVNEHMDSYKPITILRMKYTPFIDSTAVVRLNDFISERRKRKIIVILADLTPTVQETLGRNKEFNHLIDKKFIFKTTKEALSYVEKNTHHLLLEK